MVFTNFQIITIFLSFFSAIFIWILWQLKDRKVDKKKNQEIFWVLMSVFFWSAFWGFFLKLIFDLFRNYNFWFIQSEFFVYFSLWLEEFIKAFSIIIWLEMAQKRFDEVSDWVIYWVFSVLWFLFFENILYLLTLEEFSKDFLIIFVKRNIFTFSAHLSVILFSTFYAIAYLHSTKTWCKSRPSPLNIFAHIKCLWNWNYFKWFFYFIFSPFIFIFNLFKKTLPRLWIVLFWSFFCSIFLHILFDELVVLWWKVTLTVLITTLFSWFVLFKRFQKLDS